MLFSEHIILFMNLTGVWHFLLVPFDFSMFVYGTMQYSQAYHQHQQAQGDQSGRSFPVLPKQEGSYKSRVFCVSDGDHMKQRLKLFKYMCKKVTI